MNAEKRKERLKLVEKLDFESDFKEHGATDEQARQWGEASKRFLLGDISAEELKVELAEWYEMRKNQRKGGRRHGRYARNSGGNPKIRFKER